GVHRRVPEIVIGQALAMSADVAHRIFPDLNFILSSFCATEKHLFIQSIRKVRILHRVTPDIIGQA
ncbi:hypothetical protein, partial [Mesorhizobium sp.]|uniref:hypothetical protein n=1 Tax=Mesorhizobium sp. TaxID=1871066 RepID=UPI0025F853D9